MALWSKQFALSADDERMHVLEDRNQHLRQKLAALRLELASAKSIKEKHEKSLKSARKRQKEAHEQMKREGWSAEAELSGKLAVLEAKKASLITTKEIVDQEYYDLNDIRNTNKESLDAQMVSLQNNLKGMTAEKANMRSLLQDAKHRLKHRLRECESLLDAQKDLDSTITETLSLARAFVARRLAIIVQDDDILIDLKNHYEKGITVFSSRPKPRKIDRYEGSGLLRSSQGADSGPIDSTNKPKKGSRPKSAVSFTATSNTSPKSRVLIEDLAYSPTISQAPITLALVNDKPDVEHIEQQALDNTGLLTTSALIKNALEQDSSDYYRRLLNEDAIREFNLDTKDRQPSPRTSSYLEKLLLPPVQDCPETGAAKGPTKDKPLASGTRATSSSKKIKRSSSSLKRRAQQIKSLNKQYIDKIALIDILTEQRRTLQDKLINITNIRGGTYTKASTIMMIRKQIGELTAEIEEMTRALPNISVIPRTT